MRCFYPSFFVALLLSSPVAQAQTNDTIPVDKRPYWLLRPTPRRYLRPLVPDRPGTTESPYTVDAGHLQLENDALRLINHEDAQGHDRNLYLSHVLLKVGLTDKTDVQLGINSFTISKHWDAPAPAVVERLGHFGDLTVRVKRNILGDDNRPFALATLGYVRLPTGGPVEEGGLEYGLIVPAVYKLTRQWTIGSQLQAERSYDRETNHHFLLLVPTATVEREFTAWLEGFVELVGYWDAHQHQWRSSVNLGPQFDLGKNLQLDCGTHVALNRQTDREYFVGFSLRR